jgi:hypothetical protein
LSPIFNNLFPPLLKFIYFLFLSYTPTFTFLLVVNIHSLFVFPFSLDGYDNYFNYFLIVYYYLVCYTLLLLRIELKSTNILFPLPFLSFCHYVSDFYTILIVAKLPERKLGSFLFVFKFKLTLLLTFVLFLTNLFRFDDKFYFINLYSLFEPPYLGLFCATF